MNDLSWLLEPSNMNLIVSVLSVAGAFILFSIVVDIIKFTVKRTEKEPNFVAIGATLLFLISVGLISGTWLIVSLLWVIALYVKVLF